MCASSSSEEITAGVQPRATMMLRRATDGDAATIAIIWRDGWRVGHAGYVPDELVAARTEESFRSRAAQRVADAVVAVVDGVVAGFVMVVGNEVEQVYVAPEHRGTGVAAGLLAEAERIVAANGHRRAWLAVVTGNRRARRFYERSGWADEGLIRYPATTADGAVLVDAHRYTKHVMEG
jgi:GNAT superfamily N-acetyltransferase